MISKDRNTAFHLFIVSFFVLLATIVPVMESQAEVMIIANQSVLQESMTKEGLKDIFLGNTVKWDNNQKINVVVQKNTDIHAEFTKRMVKKSPSQFNNYWKKLVFTGKGSSPKRFLDVASLVEYIARTKGAIGYISSEDNAEGVKVIKVDE